MRLFRFEPMRKPIVLAWAILVFVSLANVQVDDDNAKSPTPPGLYVRSTALANAVQQPLNPGLTKYPNFVAGEAVNSRSHRQFQLGAGWSQHSGTAAI